MEKVIACCGLNCATCDARTATIANDDDLRAKTVLPGKFSLELILPLK